MAQALRPSPSMERRARWKVAIIDDHGPSRAELRAAVAAAGGEVVGEAIGRDDGLALVSRSCPDVAACAVGLSDGDGLDVAAELSRARCVVLFTSPIDDATVQRAIQAGIMACLLKPLRPAEVAPTLDVALARFRELERLRRTLDERKLIERAKGALMSRLGLGEEEAFRRLRRAAMDTRRPMVEIARAVLVSESVAEPLPTR